MKHLLQLSLLLAGATVFPAAGSSANTPALSRAQRQTVYAERQLQLNLPKSGRNQSPVFDIDGQRSDYITSGYWASASQGIGNFYFDIGILASVYDCEDNKVYIEKLIPAWQEGLLEGTREGNRITLKSGQLVSQWGIGDIYIGGAVYNSRAEKYNPTESFSFDISAETGELTLADSDTGQRVYLLAYLGDGTLLEANYGTLLDPFHEKVATPPADAETTSFIRTYFDDISKFPYKDVVHAAVSGSDIWLEGFSGTPDGFVKGTVLDNGDITIPTGQLTIASTGTYVNYMFTAEKRAEDSQIYLTDALTLTKSGDTYSSRINDYIRYGFSENTIEYQRKHFILEPYDEMARKPATPIIEGVKVLSADDVYIPGHAPGDIYVSLLIPAEDVDANLLDRTKMSYRIYVNDRLFTFTPEQYPSLESDMTELPLEFSDYKDIISMASHTIYLKTDNIAKVGVESIYDNGEDALVSDRAEMTVGQNGITQAVSDQAAVRTEFRDMLGRRIANPADGFFIMTEYLTDGTTRSTLIRK